MFVEGGEKRGVKTRAGAHPASTTGAKLGRGVKAKQKYSHWWERKNGYIGFEVEILNWIDPLLTESDQEVMESAQDVIQGQPSMIQ